MKHIVASLVAFVLLLVGCSRVSPEGELESLATWTNLGGKVDSGIYSSLAFTPEGNPIVAVDVPTMNLTGYSFSTVYVKQWIAGQWQALGGHLDIAKSRPAYSADIAVDQLGRPVVAWSESTRASTNAPYDIYVKRWDGQNWVLLGGKLDLNLDRRYTSSAPSLAIDSQSRPVVAFYDSSHIYGTNGNIYVKRWENESSWQLVGTALNTKTAKIADIAIDAYDRIVVAWVESTNIYVKRWNGDRWVPLGGALDVDVTQNAYNPSLALSSGGRPYVAWHEANADEEIFNVYVKTWDGTTWTALGGNLDTIASGQGGWLASLAVRNPGGLVIAWNTFTDPTRSYVQCWNGTQWLALGSQPVIEHSFSDLNISPAGIPMLTYYDWGLTTNPDDRGSFVMSYQSCHF